MKSLINRCSCDPVRLIVGFVLASASTGQLSAQRSSPMSPEARGSSASTTTVDWSRGPLTGAPLAFFHRHVSASKMPVPNGALIYKPHGFGGQPAREWVKPRSGPSFDFATELGRFGWFAGLEIDASSLGMDWILADKNGVATVPPGQWGALEFSVRNGSRGTGVIKTEANKDGAVGADVFTFLLPDSALPRELVGRTIRGQDASEVNIGGTLPERAEIIAMDRVIPLLRFENDFIDAMTKPIRFFFSLTGYGASKVPQNWFGTTRPSGASILEVVWDGERWSRPMIHLSYKDLGLDENEEIDALSVDLARGIVLFSTRTSWRDELLLHGVGSSLSGPVTYTDTKGEPVSKSIGILPDDEIDAVCATDPAVLDDSHPTWNGAFFQIGTPFVDTAPMDPVLTGTAIRDSANGCPIFRINVLGWHPQVGPRPGVLVAHWSAPSSNANHLLGVLARSPWSPIDGDPVEFVYKVPLNLSLSGIAVHFHAKQYDVHGNPMGRIHPIRIKM